MDELIVLTLGQLRGTLRTGFNRQIPAELTPKKIQEGTQILDRGSEDCRGISIGSFSDSSYPRPAWLTAGRLIVSLTLTAHPVVFMFQSSFIAHNYQIVFVESNYEPSCSEFSESSIAGYQYALRAREVQSGETMKDRPTPEPYEKLEERESRLHSCPINAATTVTPSNYRRTLKM
ncbi:hypothetical protein ARMSODRAFT_982518 [Armillaria solidipes]|uniref:Uncharacterized protein n=1 Tax=Armillaria solidipes TaxID=1076256 RepID=A0A2H3AZB1_9AGAR|nr:hypothetical protein ARMSODRAFT_982518 [Armillaria solidipes]